MQNGKRQVVRTAKVNRGKRVIRAVVESLDPRMLLSATGYAGGEPLNYTTTVYVDGAFTGTENGSASNPYNTLAEGFAKANQEIAAGRSTQLLVKPGVYRESGLRIDAGQNANDRSKNNNLTVQDTWFRMDRWGSSGEVIIDGADDWSVGKGEGGEWTAVAGQSNVYSRTWTRNWGLWGGAAGTANVSAVAGQRREMVFVDYGDGRGWQRLEQVALEQYTYSKPVDDGTPATWNGSGTWAYTGYAGLGALKAGSFGITELSSDASDNATDDGKNDSWQAGTVIMANAGTDPQIKQSFKQVYDSAASRAPAAETNKLFLKLPPGVNINNVRIAVTTRDGAALHLEGKHNAVLSNVTVQHYTSRMFNGGTAAVILGRTYFDWWLTSGNTLLDNVTIRENNSNGLQVSGMSGLTIRNSTLDDNGATSLNLAYSYNVKVENSIFSDAAWRSATLGGTRSFIPASFKSWKNVNLQMDNVQFTGIVDKGFYSDSALQNATFNDVTMIGTGTGSGATHEITPGPIVWNRARFENLDIGVFNIQAQKLTVTNSVFKDNRLAVSTVTKTRNDQDTVRFDQTSFPAGTSMLDHTRIDLFVDQFTLTNSSLSSNIQGARLISQFDEFSQEAAYLREFRTEAVYQNNKYYLTDHPYAFENDNDFSTFAEWIAATGETGASWDTTLTTPLPAPARPAYAAGFKWKRSTDWVDSDRFIKDANGQDTWFHMISRSRPANAGRTAATPWYKIDRDYMQFIRNRDGANKRFLKNDIFAHWASATEFVGDYAWSADYIGRGPAVTEWRNPTGKNLGLKITGNMTLTWDAGWQTGADVVIVLARKDGTYQELWGGSYTKPTSGTTTAITVSGMDNVTVGAEDKILIGTYVTTGGGYQSSLRLADNLTFEVVSIAAPSAPAAPTSAGTRNVTSSSVTVDWTDNSDDETGFVVQRATDSGFTANVQNFTVAATSGTGVRSYVDSSVTGSMTYYYRIKAVKSGATDSAWATAPAVTTPAATTVPAAPSALAAAAASSSQINLTWTDNASDETGFAVEYSTSPTFASDVTTLTINTANTISTSVTGLSAATTYYFRVRAFNAVGDSANSSTASATTSSVTMAPKLTLASATASSVESASYVAANAIDGDLATRWSSTYSDNQWLYVDLGGSYDVSRIRLYWETAAGSDYKLQIKASAPDVDTGWTDLTSVTGNTTANAWLDYSGLSGTGRYVRMLGTLRATAWGYSLHEFEVYGTPSTVVDAPPATPTGLSATAGTNQITLDWADNTESDLAGYNLYRSTTSNGTYTKINSSLLTGSSYTDSGLSAGTTYFYKVEAADAAGQTSAQTAAASATTPAAPLPAPTNLTAQALSSSQIRLNWADNASTETGYRVWRSNDGVNWTLVSTLSAGSTTYTVSGLSRNTNYYFRVSAFDSVTEAYSSSIQAKTLKR